MDTNEPDTSALRESINRQFPPSSRTLGTHLVAGDIDEGWIEMTFTMPKRFCDERGLDNGLVTAMLDTTMANTVIFCSRRTLSPPTLELKVSFLEHAGAGDYSCRAQFDYRGRTIAFLSASLRNTKQQEVARATSTVKLIPFRG